MAEWLRRWTRNPLGSPRAGSNPADYVTFVLSKVLKTSIIFNYIEPNRNTAEGSRGRVVKAMD